MPVTRASEAAVPMAPPPVSVAETPEFKEALAAAIKDLVPDLLAQVKAAQPSQDERSKDMFQGLALAIAELSDQNGGHVNTRVDPALVDQWRTAREAMVRLILKARELGVTPMYWLVGKCWLNETLLEPYRLNSATHRSERVQIGWDGEPNAAMRPANPAAEEIYAQYTLAHASVKNKHTESAPKDIHQFWMSDKGLVVGGGRAPTRRAITLGGPVVPPQEDKGFESTLSLADPFIDDPRNPNNPNRRVLGSLAPPATTTFGPRLG